MSYPAQGMKEQEIWRLALWL